MTEFIVENKEVVPFRDMSDKDKLVIVNALIDDNTSVELYCSTLL